MKPWSKQQLQDFLEKTKANMADGASIENAFAKHFGGLLQAVLEQELENELGYTKYDWKNKHTANSRNGHTKKTVNSRYGPMELDVPRDSNGEFEPVLVKKHERSLSSGVEDMILSLYTKGLSTRDISAHVKKLYEVDVSAEMVSRITDKILPLAHEWQNRPLESVYPVVYLDGMMFNVVQDGQVVKKTAYVVYAFNLEGRKDVLGIWLGEAESAKFWMKALTELKNRGVKDIFIACVDGLKGFEEAISAVFPLAEVQQCVVHQIRVCSRFVNYKDRKDFCADMKPIYTAPNEQAGLLALDAFEHKWGKKYAYAVKSWRNNWQRLSTFFKYPEEIRRMIYTTNPIEGQNRRFRKVTKTKGAFPTDESLFKLLYLVTMDAYEKWTMPMQNWGQILQQLHVYFGERLEVHVA